MKAEAASQTARYMALYRALETARPRGKRLFEDPYAIYFLGRRFRFFCRLAFWPPAARLFGRIIQCRIPGAFASGLARTRLIDDRLEQAVEAGIKQVLFLGAGFDTRAARLDILKDLPVIEIDHPNTSRLKKRLCATIAGYREQGIRYLPLDFNTQDLRQLLEAEGVAFNRPTAIIWEGVTNYLDAGAIGQTFDLLQNFAVGTYLIFTYVEQRVLTEPASFFGAERLLKDLEAIEERWTFGFDPAQLPAYLEAFHFNLLEDSAAGNYYRQYLPERKDLLKGYEFYRVAVAERVGG